MIELIVVIGIIVLAASMMTPSITSFFRNRQLQQLLTAVRGTINSARLKAVNERTKVHLVFFKEGVRVFDERENKFVDEFFDPESSPLKDEKVWYVLGFLDQAFSTDLQSYRLWQKKNYREDVESGVKDASTKRRSRRRRQKKEATQTVSLAGLPVVTFLRDGSVQFRTGTDVGSSEFKTSPPRNADIKIYNSGNSNVAYIDILMTGQNRSKVEILKEYLPTTAEALKERFKEQAATARKRGRSRRK